MFPSRLMDATGSRDGGLASVISAPNSVRVTFAGQAGAGALGVMLQASPGSKGGTAMTEGQFLPRDGQGGRDTLVLSSAEPAQLLQ